MRVVVTGATGNVGTSLVQALSIDPGVESVVGLARRLPGLEVAKTEWAVADVVDSDLAPLFTGADAVVHLAWLIQPSRDLDAVHRTNVIGSERVFRAAAEAGVKVLVYASSVGAYSPGPKDRAVDEQWPTDGVATSFYARHKAEVERRLDRFETEFPEVRVVRLRPGLIFKREAGSSVRRIFLGPLVPTPLLTPKFIPVIPQVDGLRFQVVHSADVADAYRLALTRDVRGAFNIAAEPVLDPLQLAQLLGARRLPLPAAALRGAAWLSWRLRAQPTPPGWVDMALAVPLMDVSRARQELGWAPLFGAGEALLELLDGIHQGAGLDTPPLSAMTSGRLRRREFRTGVGARST
ncbi:MAG: NAD-dependent epimerase/dehydratase family protein [Actinomycetota bacterium]|nr:NAD-dependent epimerase/dehydratase family protein [Actinomycetota bacterium]MDQ3573942.1 NAD-dependent epimerase/dehydratase family protein [Actinomycetota bacterium]